VGSFTLPRRYPFLQRLVDARDAGADGIGIFFAEWELLLADGMTVDRLGVLLDEHGLTLAELDLVNLGAHGAYAERSRRFERFAWELAERFEVRYLQAIGPAVAGDRAVENPPGFDQLVEEYAALCDRAAEVGLVVGVEYVPYTTIKTLDDALALTRAAGRPNGGVCVDVWHHRRGGSPADLSSTGVAAADVVAVQINDGPIRPDLDDYKVDCLVSRLAPGDGEFEVAELVGQLLAIGVNVPWSIEVCRDADADHQGHVAHCVRRTREVLAG
jgi:sugar phosphate isomerase/epimerase